MIAPLVLLGYAVLVATLAGRWLSRAGWTQRAPRLGIAAWQVLTASVVLAVVLAGLAVAVPALPVTTDLAALLHSCRAALREHYSTPGGAAAASAGAVLALVVTGRVVACVLVSLSRARRVGSAHRRGLQLFARRDPGSGALIVEHRTPAVYCLPGSGHEVIFTTAALSTLNFDQVSAVLAHERAHLGRRHWLVAAAAHGLAEAFPFVPLFTAATVQLAELVEMHADDTALPSSGRRVLATALVRLAEGAAPAGTLGAGGESALARVQRLTRPAQPLGPAGSVLVVAVLVLSVVFPVAVAVAPAAVAAALDWCPLGFFS